MIVRTTCCLENSEDPDGIELPSVGLLKTALQTPDVRKGAPLRQAKDPVFLSSRVFGNLLLIDLITAPGALELTLSDLLPAPLDGSFLVILIKKGSIEGTIDEMSTIVHAGDIVFIDPSGCRRLRFVDCTAYLLVLPVRNFGLASRDPVSQILPRGKLHSRMLAIHLEHLFSDEWITSRWSIQDMESKTITTVLHCLRIHPTSKSDNSPLTNELRRSVISYISDNISDTKLGAESIMRRFKISRTHLYRVFPYSGGVYRYIQDRRVDLAFRHLREYPEERVSLICGRYGFSDDRQFRRHFLRRFEMSLGEALARWNASKLNNRTVARKTSSETSS